MSDKISLKVSVDGISKYLEKMLDRSRLIEGWLNRVAYPTLIKVQRVRWQTEGASEGSTWAAIDQNYATKKLSLFRDYPGSGRKLLIATGRLIQGMTGENKSDHYKLVTKSSLEMGTVGIDYAAYVDEKRDITTLSKETTSKLSDSLGKYLAKGEE